MGYENREEVTHEMYVERIRVLEKLKDRIFDLVCQEAHEEQWAEWLRVPLEHAAAEGEVELVKSLLAAGADVDAPDFTAGPLHLALHRSTNEPIVRTLLNSGACLNRRDVHGNTPLHLVADFGYDRLLSPLLLKEAGIECVDMEGRSPLLVAAEKGRVSVTRALLEAQADVNVRDHYGSSALDLATRGGHVGVMTELLQHGVDPMSRGVFSMAPLQIAAGHDQAGAVDVLVEAGADIEGSEENLVYPWGPLRVAAECGCCAAMLALLRQNADVNAQDISGRRPLHLACRNVHWKAVELLLIWGADETSIDNNDQRASEMIGANLEEDMRLAKTNGMQRVRNLLNLAPADRAWRRRGLVVMCRAFRSSDCLGFAGNSVVGSSIELMDSVSDVQATTASNSSCATRKGEANNSDARADRGQEGRANIKGTGGEVRCDLCSLEAWVVGLEQDGLFRLIVSFL